MLFPSDFMFATHGAIPLAEMTGRLLPNIGYQILLSHGHWTNRGMLISPRIL